MSDIFEVPERVATTPPTLSREEWSAETEFRSELGRRTRRSARPPRGGRSVGGSAE